MRNIFLQVPHVEDDDVDLFAFSTLDAAVAYLKTNQDVDAFLMFSAGAMPQSPDYGPEEYTFVE